MKLGKRTLFIIGVIIVVLVAVPLWVVRWQTRGDASRNANVAINSAAPSPARSDSAVSPIVTANSISTPSTDAERHQNAINQLETAPIAFFGKVVDQYDSPVAGARVTYTVHHLKFSGNSPSEGPVTDNDGSFEIRTQGPSITVSVSHPQFYKGDAAEREVDYGRVSTASPYSPRPTRENPTLFRLVRKGQAEWIVYIPSKEIRLPLDGRPVEITMGERSLSIALRLRSGSPTLKQNEFKHFDWSLTLAASNGGLIERVNSTDFQAPETGYIAEIDVRMVSDSNLRWSSRINKNYFVHFADGRYGRFQISVSGETGFCRFESYLNPSGSRNLEVDPAKLVRASGSHDN